MIWQAPHVEPLYITATKDDYEIHKVLIDGGAGLNVCPLATAKILGPWSRRRFQCVLTMTLRGGTTKIQIKVVRVNWWNSFPVVVQPEGRGCTKLRP